MDFEAPRFTRHCAVTGKELAAGEEFYSVLIAEGAELVRRDYSAQAWQGPPEGAIGSWKSKVPGPNTRRMHWAPNDVMLHLFDELELQPERQDMRYVLALLLLRRRVFRMEGEEQDAQGRGLLVLYCPRREATYKVPVVVPEDPRIQEIQGELARLLFAHAA